MFDPFQIFRTSTPAAGSAASNGLHFSYEKAGLVIHNQPIPWNAEAVSVEGVVKVPAVSSEVRAGFSLHRPGQPPLAPETLRRTDVPGQARVIFRFAAAPKVTVAELRYQSSSLGQLTLPVVSQADYLRTLDLGEAIGLHVRLGDETCACRSYVTSQAKEMYASALLVSPTNLVPPRGSDRRGRAGQGTQPTAGWRVWSAVRRSSRRQPSRTMTSARAARAAAVAWSPLDGCWRMPGRVRDRGTHADDVPPFAATVEHAVLARRQETASGRRSASPTSLDGIGTGSAPCSW